MEALVLPPANLSFFKRWFLIVDRLPPCNNWAEGVFIDAYSIPLLCLLSQALLFKSCTFHIVRRLYNQIITSFKTKLVSFKGQVQSCLILIWILVLFTMCMI